MREESHLDDMRAALRGDFDRLAERRGSQELMHVSADEASAGPELEPVEEHPPPARRSLLGRLGFLPHS